MVQSLASLNASQQASAILEAWVRQDPIALRMEFEKGLSLCAQPPALGCEDERIELLKTVVSRLGVSAVDRAEPADPVVRLCLSLLMHLAAQS